VEVAIGGRAAPSARRGGRWRWRICDRRGPPSSLQQLCEAGSIGFGLFLAAAVGGAIDHEFLNHRIAYRRELTMEKIDIKSSLRDAPLVSL
jgi:hypothetical protein